jgi:hypothetical protein
LFLDGHDSHWGAETLQYLLQHHVHVIFLKANDSINDQPNDGGPNCSFRSHYNRRYTEWLRQHPSVPYNAAFFNSVVALAWQDFVDDPGTPKLIVKAFRQCHICPLVDPLDPAYQPTSKDRSNAALASLLVTDARDKETLRSFSGADAAAAAVSFEPVSKYTLATVTRAVSPTEQPDAYQFAINSAILTVLSTSQVIPAQALKEAFEEHRLAKAVSVRKPTSEALLTDSTTGVCCAGPMIAALAVVQAASKASKVAKASKQEATAEKKAIKKQEQRAAKARLLTLVESGGDLESWKLPELVLAYRGFKSGGKAKTKKELVRELTTLTADANANA